MEKATEDLVMECREFIRLKKLFKIARNPGDGSPAYLVSTNWLKKYKTYIFHKEIKSGTKPQPDVDHCLLKHPGIITNDEDFCD